MEKQLISGKRHARKLAMQALYQWFFSGHELCEIETQFRCMHAMEKASISYFQCLLYGVPKHIEALEEAFQPFLVDRTIQSLNPIELTILRLATFELLHCLEVPYRVVLNEAVSLTKTFGSQDGYRYVNGVLNNLAKITRAIEISTEHG